MFWNEDEDPDGVRVPTDIVDLLFGIDCRRIPVDHAHLLATALGAVIPWIGDESSFAVHAIYVAGSQNGWERPEHGTDSYLMVSRRTKLTLRVPQHRVPELLKTLPGTELDLGGDRLLIQAGKVKHLSTEPTQFARSIVLDAIDAANDPETRFLEAAAGALAGRGIAVRKAICGRIHRIATPHGAIPARSLMLAGLTPQESIRLQQQGLGQHRLLGCGIFIPHKGIDAVKPAQP